MGDWTPGNLTYPPDLWLDANDGATITIDTGVSQLADKSGNGRHAVQSTAAYQPTVSSGSLNGLDTLLFASLNFLTVPRGFISSACSIFIVHSGGGAGQRLIDQRGLGGVGLVKGYQIKNYQSTTTDLAGVDSGAGYYRWSYNTLTQAARVTEVIFPVSGNLQLLNTGTDITANHSTGPTPTDIDNTGVDIHIGCEVGESTSQAFTGNIGEILMFSSVLDDETRQIIEGYLAWKWGLQASLPSGHPYESGAPQTSGSFTSVIAALVGEYGDFSQVINAMVGKYSLIMETALLARYGDAPVRLAALVGRYGNSPMVRAALVGKYGDMVRISAAMVGRYDILHDVVAGLVGEYAITGADVLAALDGRYDLRERDAILAALEGYYSILPAALILQISFSVLIGGVAVDVADATWTESEGSYLVEATITLRDPAQWAVIAKQDTVAITWMGTTWNLFVAAKLRSRSISGGPGSAEYGADYTVVARSLSAALDAPYALPVTLSWDAPTMASQIAADIIDGMDDVVSVDFQLEDWLQPGGTFFVTDQSPLDGLRSLAALVGGIIQTDPDNGIILRMADQVAPASWSNSAPAWTIEDSGVFSDSEAEQPTNQYNVITVTNQGQSSDSTSFEVEEITAYRKTVKGYRVPWVDFALATSGGSWVTIDDLGVIEEQISEEVEFVDGDASASKPIYSAVSAVWQEDSLGAVTGAEDGTMTAAISGCSRATITYTTKYHAWIGVSDRDETVQFYQVEI